MRGNRVLVVGTSGSGKSTPAAAPAAGLGVPHVELDALRDRPGWAEAPDPDFVRAVDTAVPVDGGWVADGNYAVVRDLLPARATDVVWLDLPRWLVVWRVVRRSVARVATERELWNGNPESWRDWLRPDHPIRWAWTTHSRRRAEYAALAAGDPRWLRVHRRRLRPRTLRKRRPMIEVAAG